MKLVTAISAIVALSCAVSAMAAQSETLTIEEVIVTATKRSENLQDIGVSVTAFTAADLEDSGIRTSSDVGRYTPNLSFHSQTSTGFSAPFLRGVGTSDLFITSSPAVGLVIDGVFMQSTGANVFNLVDAERIEVLRGPQGTLYGRNAVGGVINIVSKKPSDQPEGRIQAGYGNLDAVEVSGMFNTPMIEDLLSSRLTVRYSDRDGYKTNAFTSGEDDLEALETLGARGSLYFTPSDGLSLTLIGDYAKNQGSYLGFKADSGSLLPLFLDPTAAPYEGFDNPNDIHEVDLDGPNDEESVNWGVSATVEWQFDETVGLTSVTAYREAELDNIGADADSTSLGVFHNGFYLEESVFSQELRLDFDGGGNWTGLLGVYYFEHEGDQESIHDSLGFFRDVLGAPFFDPADPVLSAFNSWFVRRRVLLTDTQSWAVFGSFDYAINERLTLTLGGRMSWSSQDFSFDSNFEDGGPGYGGYNDRHNIPEGIIIYPDPTGTGLDEDDSWSRFTPRVELKYNLAPEMLLYAHWSQGYRDGGFNGLPLSGALSTFDEELLDAYEIGFKSTLFERRLRLNVASFYYDYQDLQVVRAFNAGTVENPDFIQRTDNAGSAESYGLELEVLALPLDNLELGFNMGLLHTEFNELDTVDDSGVPVDYSGNRLQRSPELSLSFIPQYTLDLENAGSLTLRGELNYRSEEYFTAGNAAEDSQTGYSLLNARLTYESAKGNWRVALWGKNLADKEYLTETINLRALGYTAEHYGDPRTFGISLSADIF